jgi:putative alpha-1,2-mannosidase
MMKLKITNSDMYFKWVVVAAFSIMPFVLPAQHLTKYVDPFIGTGGHGHTYPGATVPFGMVQLSPDNGTQGWDWCSGYHYTDSMIAGFSHTHLSGTGIGDLCDISVMPSIGLVNDTIKLYQEKFSHKNEKASRVIMR